jgi:hypothetical protein
MPIVTTAMPRKARRMCQDCAARAPIREPGESAPAHVSAWTTKRTARGHARSCAEPAADSPQRGALVHGACARVHLPATGLPPKRRTGGRDAAEHVPHDRSGRTESPTRRGTAPAGLTQAVAHDRATSSTSGPGDRCGQPERSPGHRAVRACWPPRAQRSSPVHVAGALKQAAACTSASGVPRVARWRDLASIESRPEPSAAVASGQRYSDTSRAIGARRRGRVGRWRALRPGSLLGCGSDASGLREAGWRKARSSCS